MSGEFDADKYTRPTPAATRDATSAVARPTPAATISPGAGETPKEKVYRIKRAMEIAAKPATIDGILEVNQADLALIEEAAKGAKTINGQRVYHDLLAYAERRKAELVKPPIDGEVLPPGSLADKVAERLGA
jgi:fructose-specific component phosphotransferase system IIB-like protein